MIKYSPINKLCDWQPFKDKVINRNLSPQSNEEVIDGIDYYVILAQDGFLLFQCKIIIGSDEAIDFETNFKNIWNKQLTFADSTGISQVMTSARPVGTTTFFTSIDDNGNILEFNFTENDTLITKDLTFNEDIWIKDGGINFENAPFGAYFDVFLVHPQVGVVAKLCRNVLIYGTHILPINSEDKFLVSEGLIIRVNIYNGNIKVPFKATAWLEGFRKTLT